MEIIITKLDGTSYPMTVNPHDTVGHLKIHIQNELGLPVHNQKLMFVNGQMTLLSNDSKPLSYYSLQSGSQVSLLIVKPPTIQVFLKNEKGQTSTYDIKPNETVSNFKLGVEQREGVPVSHQRLIHQSEEMTTGRLQDYNVGALSTIFLNLRLIIQQQQQPPTIQVFLKNEKGQTSTYDIKPNETVSNFKLRVEEREGVPVRQQRLIHQSREMTTGRLQDYNVGALSTIFLNLRLIIQQQQQPPTIQVFLKNEKGQTSTYDINPNETVSNFKLRVEQREGLPVSQQRLIHQSLELTTGSLKDYNVGALSTIFLNLRLIIQQQQQPPTIQVFLKNEKGQTSTYDIKPNETVSNFKLSVEEREGVPGRQQRLIHQSREMTTGRLRDYNVEALSTIFLTLRLTIHQQQPPTIQVLLKNEKGQTSTYDIKPNEMVSDFKLRVEQREGVPVSQQRLIHQSLELTAGSLKDYNVGALSTIFLTLRLRGD